MHYGASTYCILIFPSFISHFTIPMLSAEEEEDESDDDDVSGDTSDDNSGNDAIGTEYESGITNVPCLSVERIRSDSASEVEYGEAAMSNVRQTRSAPLSLASSRPVRPGEQTEASVLVSAPSSGVSRADDRLFNVVFKLESICPRPEVRQKLGQRSCPLKALP